MLNGHVAEVKYKVKGTAYTFTGTPDFQISLLLSLPTPVFKLQTVLRQVTSASNDPKVTFNTKRSKVPVARLNSPHI